MLSKALGKLWEKLGESFPKTLGKNHCPLFCVASHGSVSRAAPCIWISAAQIWFLMACMPLLLLNRASGVISI